MIDTVNRYKFRSASPKFIIQLADASKLQNILANWNLTLFRGCKICTTIHPEPDSHSAMVRGIPFDISEEQFAEDISPKYNISYYVYRLKTRDNTILRTVKIEFGLFDHLLGSAEIRNISNMCQHHSTCRAAL